MEINLDREKSAELLVVQETLRHYLFPQDLFPRDLSWQASRALSLEYVNIEHLATLFEIHGVVPQAAIFFTSWFPQHPLTEHLSNRHMVVACNNLRVESLMDGVSETLRRSGVPSLVLKGIPLAKRLYRSMADRTVSDTDILVSITDKIRADVALKEFGLKPVIEPVHAVAARLYDNKEPLEYRSAHGDIIDLHYADDSQFLFAPGSYLDLLKKYAWGADTNGAKPPVCSDVDCFSFLLEHGTKHMWYRLVWLLDIALLFRESYALSLPFVEEEFSKTKNGKALQLVFSLLSTYGLLPKDCQGLGGDVNPSQKRIMRRHALIGNRPELVPRDIFMHLSLLDGWRSRLHYFCSRAFLVKSRDILPIKLPRWLGWSYPFIRIFRLLARRVERFIGPIYRGARRIALKYTVLIETLLVAIYSRLMVRFFGRVVIRQENALSTQKRLTNGGINSRKAKEADLTTAIYLVESIKSGRKVLGRGSCFTEAFMLQLMLARRRIPSKIQFGAKQAEDSQFLAHAWLEIDGVPVFGFEEQQQFLRFVDDRREMSG